MFHSFCYRQPTPVSQIDSELQLTKYCTARFVAVAVPALFSPGHGTVFLPPNDLRMIWNIGVASVITGTKYSHTL
jgi:hypothetical protein